MVSKAWVRSVAAFAAVASISGCASAELPTSAAPSPTAPITRPADSQSLRSLGVRNGPADFYVPDDVVVVIRIDQPNVVTLVFREPTADELVSFFVANVEQLGFELVSHTDETVLFRNAGYDGAFASGGGEAGLTLRNLDPSVGPE